MPRSSVPGEGVTPQASHIGGGSHGSPESTVSRGSAKRKRSEGGPGASPGDFPDSGPGSARRAKKVSRACDYCKTKKLKCSGTVPCDGCTKRKLACEYDTQYRRGRPPTPPPAYEQLATQADGTSAGSNQRQPYENLVSRESSVINPSGDGNHSTSRASPELESAEIQGQYFDLTSSLTFLHRAWKRLSAQRGTNGAVPEVLSGNERHQNLFSAGDKPFAVHPSDGFPTIPDRATAMEMLKFYFEVCVITYRFLHRGTVASWFNAVIVSSEANLPLSYGLGHAKASIVMSVLAIVTMRQGKIDNAAAGTVDGDFAVLQRSDAFFCASTKLTDAEVGYPTLESAQARLLQVLYLLQSTRMNQAWFVFGSTLPIVSALGLHRRRRGGTKPGGPAAFDYIASQCRKRTFWVAYTIDKYLAVVFGRPCLYRDDDIDQDFPDCVNDEDMTPHGRAAHEPDTDCHIDSLIFHARLAQLIDRTSREVYSIKKVPHRARLEAATEAGRALHEWRAALPHHLGSLRPMSLIPPFRRQATALKLAYSHAIMHANRPFLLGAAEASSSSSPLRDSVSECLSAARVALETVDAMAADGTLFHAFWWTPYVTFCALAVVYIWEIQQHRDTRAALDEDLLALAERCQNHLAQATAPDSPSRRYSVILEELRLEAKYRGGGRRQGDGDGDVGAAERLAAGEATAVTGYPLGQLAATAGVDGGFDAAAGLYGINPGNNPLDDWQTTDWLDLDSSAFGPFPDFESQPIFWMASGPHAGACRGTSDTQMGP